MGLLLLMGPKSGRLAFGTAPADGFVGYGGHGTITVNGAVPGSTVTLTPATGDATSGNTAVADGDGIAEFAALVLDTYAAAQTLTASAPGAVDAESDAFAVWSPESYGANAAPWLRADLGVTLRSAQYVTNWVDQGASAFDFAQASASNQPEYVAGAGPNGRDVVRFTKANSHYLGHASFNALNGATKATFIWVAKFDGPLGGATDAYNHVLVNRGGQPAGLQGFNNEIYGYAAGKSGKKAFTSTANKVFRIVFDGAGATDADRLKLYINDVQQTGLTFSGTVPASISSSAGMEIGRPWAYAGAYFDGDVAEMLMVGGSALKPGDDATLDAYLSTLYGLT